MLQRAIVASLPDVDDWLFSTRPASIKEQKAPETHARRRAALLYWDIGKGKMSNLSAEDAAIVREAIRKSYARYRSKRIVESRPYWTLSIYARYLWTWQAKGIWQRELRARARAVMEAA